LLLLALFLASSGCGTVMNLQEGGDPKFNTDKMVTPRSIYGGVRLDASILGDGVTEAASGKISGKEAAADIPFVVLVVVDMPLSALADTLVLPITVSETLRRQSRWTVPGGTLQEKTTSANDLRAHDLGGADSSKGSSSAK
jgi:uncharacterized protein YceK